jgi:hypothetical protein
MDLESRNQEIRNLLDLWQWCSRTLHVQWERKRKYRNGCPTPAASWSLVPSLLLSPIA